jgi:hypothetical protein
MRYATDNNDYPFDTDNRAYQRLLRLSGEHLDTMTWTRDDGRPVMLTLYDLDSGDVFTVAILDSAEARDAHALLALHRDDTLTVHGPFDGETTAACGAPALALADPTVAATLPLPLHHPGSGALPPDDAWRPLPPLPTSTADAPPASGQPSARAALVLLDQQRQRLAVVGPFPNYTAALSWEPTTLSDAGVDCVVVAMHVGTTLAPTGGEDE